MLKKRINQIITIVDKPMIKSRLFTVKNYLDDILDFIKMIEENYILELTDNFTNHNIDINTEDIDS